MLDTISLKRQPGTRKAHDHVIATCCQECSVGCGLLAYVKDERIVDIQGNDSHPISKGRLCARGIAFVQGLTAKDRITLPGTRNRLGGPFEAFDNWEQAIDLLAERLRRVKEQHGAESLVVGCDPEAGLDFYLGARRFAGLFGTPHVYHPWQESSHPDLPEDKRRPSAESAAWSASRCLVLVEADLAATHPVAFRRVLDAQRAGTKIIAVDSRFTTTLAKADVSLLIPPNRGNDLGLALLKALLELQLIDSAAGETAFDGFQQWLDTYAALSMTDLTAAVGVDEQKITALARAMGRHQPVVMVTAKRLAFARHYGVWQTLVRVMGWQGQPGGGWYPLESGTPPLDPTVGLETTPAAQLKGDRPVSPYPSPGLDSAAFTGSSIKALIGSGNCLEDFLQPLKKQVHDLDLSVFYGSFPNATRQAAHMVFPATAWAEGDRIGFTDEGAVQWSPRIVKPHDACRTGLGFWMRLAQRFGWEEYFPWQKENGLADPKAFYGWLFEKSPTTGDLQMDVITAGDSLVYWGQGPGDEATDIQLMPAPSGVPVRPTPDDPAAYPLGFHATRTPIRSSDACHWWPWARELADEMGIRIHPRIAEALDIENGMAIVVAAEDEIIEGPATISRSVPPQLVWSMQRMRADRVLVYRKGQAPEEARDRLKGIE